MMRSQKVETERGDPAVERVAAMIRKRSAAARLISEPEILILLEEHDRAKPETKTPDETLPALLDRAVRETGDLQRLAAADSEFYYSSRYMTETYARLLLRKLGDPLNLIAETVRHNADAYQRPVPIEIFLQSPFDLTRDQVLEFLTAMSGMDGYSDIATASTSVSGVYLYSTTYLEPDHADMLAEWFDLGQSENP